MPLNVKDFSTYKPENQLRLVRYYTCQWVKVTKFYPVSDGNLLLLKIIFSYE